MPITATANSEKVAFSRKVKRVLGLDLHSWEQLMLLSLGVAGLLALAVFLTTAAVVILTRDENAKTKAEFDSYKVEAGKQIAGAQADVANAVAETAKSNERIAGLNKETARLSAEAESARAAIAGANERAAKAEERAAEAKLELEKFKAPRTITPDQQARIVTKLSAFSGRLFDMATNSGDPEAGLFLDVVEDILLKAGWTQLDWKGGDLVFKRASKKDVGIVTMVGMFVQMDPSKVTEFTQPAYTLQEAFKAEGIAARAEPGSASTAENKEAMHILIGKKP